MNAANLRCRMAILAASTALVVGLGACLSAVESLAQEPRAPAQAQVQVQPQLRPHGQPIAVDPAAIAVDDGDTVLIHWADGDEETVRILGIDTPETRHEAHGIPFDQPFGPEARSFCQGVFSAATGVKLLRAATLDPYGRTLGYLFVNGKNYSVLAIRARFSDETVSHYGDNGLPGPAAEVTAAAKNLGPLRFEPPHAFRKRMRAISDWEKPRTPEP